MCCRYYFDDETYENVIDLADNISKEAGSWKNVRKDILPADRAIVLCCDRKGGPGIEAAEMNWGFESKDSRLLINARAESAYEKKTFSESIRRRRCVIPAKHFYEWDAEKNKNIFSRQDGSCLYLAGSYDLIRNENHFVILTCGANASMKPVHDRMPLILEESRIFDWLFDDDGVKEFLAGHSPELARRQDYEQLSLF